MKKIKALAAAAVALSLGVMLLAGCSSSVIVELSGELG